MTRFVKSLRHGVAALTLEQLHWPGLIGSASERKRERDAGCGMFSVTKFAPPSREGFFVLLRYFAALS